MQNKTNCCLKFFFKKHYETSVSNQGVQIKVGKDDFSFKTLISKHWQLRQCWIHTDAVTTCFGGLKGSERVLQVLSRSSQGWGTAFRRRWCTDTIIWLGTRVSWYWNRDGCLVSFPPHGRKQWSCKCDVPSQCHPWSSLITRNCSTYCSVTVHLSRAKRTS